MKPVSNVPTDSRTESTLASTKNRVVSAISAAERRVPRSVLQLTTTMQLAVYVGFCVGYATSILAIFILMLMLTGGV